MTDTATTGLTDTEAAEFRQKCVDFMDQYGTKPAANLDDQKAFLAASAGAGLAGLPVAAEYGGGGLTLAHEKIWREVKGNYPMPDGEFIISHGMCLPMLAEYGTHEQKERFLADNISGKTMWCQMFSEPGAGSDVASLQTKAELDGDEWVLNGQKVWTTLAHKSDYGLVVARTDPDQVKHAGISMFILDMRGQGVEIRPIHQIDGGSHFNEVFMTDARIPKDWLEPRHGDVDVRACRHRWRRRRQDQPAELQDAAQGRRVDRPDQQSGGARSDDEDLVDGDLQVAGGDEDPRRDEGR